MGGEKPSRRIWIQGSKVKGIHSDDRSIAGHISKILQTPLPPKGFKKEFQNGLFHGQGGLKDTLIEWEKSETDVFVLDRSGLRPMQGTENVLLLCSKNSLLFVLISNVCFTLSLI